MALEKPRRASRRRLTITVPRSSADAYEAAAPVLFLDVYSLPITLGP